MFCLVHRARPLDPPMYSNVDQMEFLDINEYIHYDRYPIVFLTLQRCPPPFILDNSDPVMKNVITFAECFGSKSGNLFYEKIFKTLRLTKVGVVSLGEKSGKCCYLQL